MTFQIALVGRDGLVIGSDRRGRYGGAPVQMFSQKKYFVSASRSLVCFAAGGPTALNLARQISIECDSLKLNTETERRDVLYKSAASAPGSPAGSTVPSIDDEVIIAWRDVIDSFWLILRRPGVISVPTVLQQHSACTGIKTAALFLPRHLWRLDRPVSDLKKLALLTLAYAAHEEPSSVAAPFDIVSLGQDRTITEETYNSTHEQFHDGLERLFVEHDA